MASDAPRLRSPFLWAALTAVALLLLGLLQPHLAPARRALDSVLGSRAAATRVQGAGERSELADRLNAPDGSVHADLRLIDQIFIAYRAGTHDEDPVGENREITAALMGRNRIGYAFIPNDCPAVNAKGELCDRWGTPYFFHQLSGQRMEIRSAGPDRRLWTADDEVLTP